MMMEIPAMIINTAPPHMFDDEKGKLFVGGLSWDTTHTTLLDYFGKFGEVVDCVVMKNQITGKSRGFGFVKFKEMEAVHMVMSRGPHYLDGRQVDPKVCNPRCQNLGGKSVENSRRKIFIGGLPPTCDEAQLREVFRRYGSVEECTIMYDQDKNKSRGFGFITFDAEDTVDKVCSDHYININGKQVEIKRAEPRTVRSMADTGGRLPVQTGFIMQPGSFPYQYGSTVPAEYNVSSLQGVGAAHSPSAGSMQAELQQASMQQMAGHVPNQGPIIICGTPFLAGQACTIPFNQYGGFYCFSDGTQAYQAAPHGMASKCGQSAQLQPFVGPQGDVLNNQYVSRIPTPHSAPFIGFHPYNRRR